jgi:hypothetical protein
MDFSPTPPDAPARLDAPLDSNEFTIAIDEAAELYARAGHPRTIRRVQTYCARGDLDCPKVETTFGEKYMITRSSIDKHIAQIEDGLAASRRDGARPGAPEDPLEIKPVSGGENATPPIDVPAPRRDGARPGAPEDAASSDFQGRYLEHLEKENMFLREQNTVLLERVKETNIITAKLQSMLSPFLGLGDRRSPPDDRTAGDTGEVYTNQ